MSFDVTKFKQTEYVRRTSEVKLPDLKEFFGKGEKPVWVVQNLEGDELSRVHDAVSKSKRLSVIVDALAQGTERQKADAIHEIIGTGKDVHDETVRRIELLVFGSKDPVCDHELAVKFCKSFPTEFYQLTNEIMRLTGMGAEAKKKPKNSTKTKE